MSGDRKRTRASLLLSIWPAQYGVYPLADPGHSDLTLLTFIDLTVHVVAAGWLLVLLSRWYKYGTIYGRYER